MNDFLVYRIVWGSLIKMGNGFLRFVSYEAEVL